MIRLSIPVRQALEKLSLPVLIAAAFALSTLVIVLSPLARLRVLPEPACA